MRPGNKLARERRGTRWILISTLKGSCGRQLQFHRCFDSPRPWNLPSTRKTLDKTLSRLMVRDNLHANTTFGSLRVPISARVYFTLSGAERRDEGKKTSMMAYVRNSALRLIRVRVLFATCSASRWATSTNSGGNASFPSSRNSEWSATLSVAINRAKNESLAAVWGLHIHIRVRAFMAFYCPSHSMFPSYNNWKGFMSCGEGRLRAYALTTRARAKSRIVMLKYDTLLFERKQTPCKCRTWCLGHRSGLGVQWKWRHRRHAVACSIPWITGVKCHIYNRKHMETHDSLDSRPLERFLLTVTWRGRVQACRNTTN